MIYLSFNTGLVQAYYVPGPGPVDWNSVVKKAGIALKGMAVWGKRQMMSKTDECTCTRIYKIINCGKS